MRIGLQIDLLFYFFTTSKPNPLPYKGSFLFCLGGGTVSVTLVIIEICKVPHMGKTLLNNITKTFNILKFSYRITNIEEKLEKQNFFQLFNTSQIGLNFFTSKNCIQKYKYSFLMKIRTIGGES